MTDKRFRYGICIWCLPETGPEACALAADVGLEGLELDIGSWEDDLPLNRPSRRAEYLSAGREHDIIFMTLGANTLCNHGMSNSAETPVVRDVLKAVVKTASAMGIPKIQLPSFIDGFITNEDELALTAENLRFVCDLAANENLIVGAENAISAEDNLRLADMVDRPNLRFYFDNSNPEWFGGGMYAPSMIPKMADKICEYHFKDEVQDADGQKHFVLLGEGKSTFVESAEAMLASGYNGWVLLENDYKKHLRIEDLRTDLATLKKVMD